MYRSKDLNSSDADGRGSISIMLLRPGSHPPAGKDAHAQLKGRHASRHVHLVAVHLCISSKVGAVSVIN